MLIYHVLKAKIRKLCEWLQGTWLIIIISQFTTCLLYYFDTLQKWLLIFALLLAWVFDFLRRRQICRTLKYTYSNVPFTVSVPKYASSSGKRSRLSKIMNCWWKSTHICQLAHRCCITCMYNCCTPLWTVDVRAYYTVKQLLRASLVFRWLKVPLMLDTFFFFLEIRPVSKSQCSPLLVYYPWVPLLTCEGFSLSPAET